jgi:hypothetical protein
MKCDGLYYRCRCDACLEYLPGGWYSRLYGPREMAVPGRRQ